MHVVLGATGHIGSALTQALLDKGEPVTAVVRDEAKRRRWEERGAKVCVADVHDVDALREVFRTAKRIFVLNPPAAPKTDTVREERATATAIVAALDGLPLEKIVAESTYGAQPGNEIGDLGVLFELEQALRKLAVPSSIMRGAYYFTNWDLPLEKARETGVLQTFYPPDFVLPMVDPSDIGRIGAELMMQSDREPLLHHVEGPARYSSADVAACVGARAEQTPRGEWMTTLEGMGFSEAAARSFCGMTDATLRAEVPAPERTLHGPTTLAHYVDASSGS